MERAVRFVFESREQYESQWAAIESIVGKIGGDELYVKFRSRSAVKIQLKGVSGFLCARPS